MYRKAALSWNCSWLTSCGWSFFFCRGLVAQAGDLVAQGDEFFGHRLEVPEIVHILLHLGGPILRDTLGALFAVEETLEDVVRAPRGRAGRVGFEKLFTQRPAAEAVDGLHLIEQGLSRVEERVEIRIHGKIVSLQIQFTTSKHPSCLRFPFWVTQRSHTHWNPAPPPTVDSARADTAKPVDVSDSVSKLRGLWNPE
jgi:hypothetical protein